MAKRVLCMLLAALTAFSLCAPAYGEEPVTEGAETPAAPRLEKVENVANGMKIAWEAVPGAEEYILYYRIIGQWHVLARLSDTSYTWTDARPGVRYMFTVLARSGAGYSEFDPDGIMSMIRYAPPKVKIAAAKEGIEVSWDRVPGVIRYAVYCREIGGAWHRIGTTVNASYTCAASRLKSGGTYQFTVRCMTGDKKTLLSGYEPSNSLRYLAAPRVKIARTAGGIKVSWNRVPGAERYAVYYREKGGEWKKIGTTTASSYLHAASKLKNGRTYQFTVRCVTGDKKTLLSGFNASNALRYKK